MLQNGAELSAAAIEIVGAVAACLTTGSFFPQALQTLRTGETAGLSLPMYLVLVAGVVLWLIYGMLIGSWPLIIANMVSLMPQTAILIMLLRARRRASLASAD